MPLESGAQRESVGKGRKAGRQFDGCQRLQRKKGGWGAGKLGGKGGSEGARKRERKGGRKRVKESALVVRRVIAGQRLCAA